MHSKSRTFKPEFPICHGPRVKAIGLRMSVTTPDWEKEVRRAFNLVKSAGQELNITFSAAG